MRDRPYCTKCGGKVLIEHLRDFSASIGGSREMPD
jgi:hypothetical protein